MMSPETCYEKELKGKSPQEIEKIIDDINQEMKSLRKAIEAGYFCYGGEEDTRPENRKKLELCRSYLEESLKAHKQAGGDYKLSEEEQHIADFDAAIPHITKIVLQIDQERHFGGERYTVLVDDENAKVWIHFYDIPAPTLLNCKPVFSIKKEEFMEKLRNIHIGEWRSCYSPSDYGRAVMDGEDWKVQIEYGNGLEAVNFSGSNAYPFSFWVLYDLVGGNFTRKQEEDFEEEDE